MAEHIHTWDDGRGHRRVFVDGKEMNRVRKADTKRGRVWYVPYPVRVNAKFEAVEKVRKGKVTVEFING